MRIPTILFALALFPFGSQCASSAEMVRLTDATTVVFASRDAARAALQTPDQYTKALSRFDLESRLKTNGEAAAEDLMRLAAEQVVGWSDEDRAKLEAIIARIAGRFAPFELPLPPCILLIQTTGKEEGDAAYCRRHAVILPQRYVGFPAAQLESILIHELFHVLSSHNTSLRHSLYEIVGFKPCPEVALPESLADFKITNPDGPSLSYYIDLDVNGQPRQAVPLLYSAERFDPTRNKSFFGYLKFRLLVVEQNGDRWTVAEQAGAPILLDPDRTPHFHRQIGRNTKYIIHPDEILADNFVHLVMQKPDLPNPEIVSKIAALLKVDDN